jgi:UDP-N-acetylmuramoyl-tripeptide--D-alanyl-D-alanine ligase
MHSIILLLLAFFSRLIIQVHKPYIIGVTGTVGKTTITNHVAHFLSSHFWGKKVGYSQYHYNGEYGLPLTIIGVKSPWKNPFLWIAVFVVAITKLFRPYPKYLVLEYGIDHPGEMDFLISIAQPNIAILTPVESNHLEQFGSLELYRKNKLQLIAAAKYAIVHESLRQYIDTDALFYSLGALSDIDASNITMSIEGTHAIAHYKGQDFPISLPSIGSFQIENILPLFPVSSHLGIDPKLISVYTENSIIESGRSTILPGIDSTTIIDGSYNGGYLSLREWIVSMRSFLHSHRIIFFLWDMRELWVVSKEIHEKLANDILDIIPHDANVIFYLVWPLMSEYIFPILSEKYTVIKWLSSRDLWKKIAKDIKKSNTQNIVYAKGSQNTIFIEEGIKCILKNESDIYKLPRQSETWMDKKNIFFKKFEV